MRFEQTSYSELSLLARCEKAWAYRYLDRVETGERSVALRRGSFVHDVVAAWWDEPGTTMSAQVEYWRQMNGETPEDGEWVVDRYEQRYEDARANGGLRIIGHELKFTVPIPGTQVSVLCYMDGLVLDSNGDMWVLERKTMRDWRRLNGIDVDPQVSLYVWAARASGLPVAGVLYDAIRTYRWKGDRPVDESFQSLWLARTQAQLDETVADTVAGVQRKALIASGMRPTRNIGMSCDVCDYRQHCWDSLSFGAGAGITMLDD